MAAVPSNTATLSVETSAALLGVQEIALTRGWKFSVSYQGAPVVSVVRNVIVAGFLDSDADMLLMIDSDQGIAPATIQNMIDLDQPVVGCISPKRKFNWSGVNLASAGSLDEMLYQASEYVGDLECDAEGIASIENGFARAIHVGAGVLLIRRTAFEQLMIHFPELKGIGFDAGTFPGLKSNWGFFNAVNQEDGLPLSEDYSFCRRWRATGGEIWAEVADDITHVGRYAFKGNYLEYLKAIGSGA
jgi:hypothetical protein